MKLGAKQIKTKEAMKENNFLKVKSRKNMMESEDGTPSGAFFHKSKMGKSLCAMMNSANKLIK